MDDDFILDIISERVNPDGTIDIDIEISDEFVEKYKQKTGKKRVSRKELQLFVEKMIQELTYNDE